MDEKATLPEILNLNSKLCLFLEKYGIMSNGLQG